MITLGKKRRNIKKKQSRITKEKKQSVITLTKQFRKDEKKLKKVMRANLDDEKNNT